MNLDFLKEGRCSDSKICQISSTTDPMLLSKMGNISIDDMIGNQFKNLLHQSVSEKLIKNSTNQYILKETIYKEYYSDIIFYSDKKNILINSGLYHILDDFRFVSSVTNTRGSNPISELTHL